MVETALKYYVEMSLDVATFAEMLSLTPAAARSILQGVSWKHVPRPAGFSFSWRTNQTRPPVQADTLEGVLAENQEWAEKIRERKRERQRERWRRYVEEQLAAGKQVRHQLTDRELEAAFVRFSQEKWTVAQFAEAYEFTPRYAADLLTGVRRRRVKRPFELNGTNLMTLQAPSVRERSDYVQLALELYCQENWSTVQFAEFLDISRQQACQILLGNSFADVPRPPDFIYRRAPRNVQRVSQNR